MKTFYLEYYLYSKGKYYKVCTRGYNKYSKNELTKEIQFSDIPEKAIIHNAPKNINFSNEILQDIDSFHQNAIGISGESELNCIET